MRAFVTGATGFIGRHLVEQLVDDGWRVVAAHRRSSDVSALSALGVELALAPLSDPEALRQHVPADVDAVFHLAASTSVFSGDEAAQLRTNVEGTRNVVQAALQAGARRFVHCSSEAVYGVGEDVLTESSPKLGRLGPSSYHRTKFIAERTVLDARARGLRPVVVQPAHVMGPYDRHNWARMIQMIDRQALPGIPPGAGSFVDARDVAAAMRACVDRGVVSEAYLLGGHDMSFQGLIRAIAAQLDRPPPSRVLPRPLLRSLAALKEAAAFFTGVEPDITLASVDLVSHRILVDDSRARRQLGFENRPLDETLRDTIAWMRDEGMLAAAGS